MKEDLFGKVDSKYYDHPCNIFALDEYRKDGGQDEFSRKQVWFYVYGDDELEKFFETELRELIDDRFVDDSIEWDLITLYPTHVKGEINSNMQKLMKSISSAKGISYRQVLERNKTIQENHELESVKSKLINLENSLDVKEFEEKNVIIVDNISLTGTSILHGANKLLENGAENVFGVCLGLGASFPGKKQIERGKKASELMKDEQ